MPRSGRPSLQHGCFSREVRSPFLLAMDDLPTPFSQLGELWRTMDSINLRLRTHKQAHGVACTSVTSVAR